MSFKVIRAKKKEHFKMIHDMMDDMNKYLMSLGDRKPMKIDREQRVYLVLFKNQVVGTFCLTKEKEQYKTLYKLFIKEKFRQQGLGKKVIRHVWDNMKSEDCGITLNCYIHNTKAMKMYEDLGFKEFDRHGDFIWYYVG